MADVRTITEILRDDSRTHAMKAYECLIALDDLPWNDGKRADYQVAAQTFATIANGAMIANALEIGGDVLVLRSRR